MTLLDVYNSTVKPLPTAERLKLAAMILNDIPPQAVTDVADESNEEREWANGVARDWNAELSDPREDIYTLADGEPVDASR